MPRYVPDMNKTSYGFVLFNKGTYRLEVGEPKAFENKDNSGNAKNWGVRANAKCIGSDDDPTKVGKNFGSINFWDHSEGGKSYGKQVLAAILGAKNDEDFNERFGGLDWSYNTDDGSCGEGWHLIKGKVVDVVCGEPQMVEQGKNAGELQTNPERFLPVQG